jgi:hypothetical protein
VQSKPLLYEPTIAHITSSSYFLSGDGVSARTSIAISLASYRWRHTVGVIPLAPYRWRHTAGAIPVAVSKPSRPFAGVRRHPLFPLLFPVAMHADP